MLANAEMTLGLVNLAVSTILVIAVAWVGAKTREVSGLKESLEKSQETRCVLKHEQVNGRIELVEGRLERGDDAFGRMSEAEKKLNLMLVERIAELKDFIRVEAAAKNDMEELKKQVASMAGRFDTIERLMREQEPRIKT